MKTNLFAAALALLVTIVASAQSRAATDAETDQAISRLREGLVDSFNSGDIDRLLTHLETNAVVTWQNGEVSEGVAAVKAYYERMMKGDRPVVSKVSANPQVLGRHVQGDWAVSWGNLNDRFVLTDGRDLPMHSRFTATLVRRGDRWMVAAFHASVNAFDNPILAVALKKVSLVIGAAAFLAGILAGVIGGRVLLRPRGGGAA